MNVFSRFLLLLCAWVGFFGCSARNIYRAQHFDKPPLIPSYVHMTREGYNDAGVEPAEMGEVLITEDTLFVANETVGVEAFSRANLSKRWTFKVKNGVQSKLITDGQNVYFGGEDGNFYAVDAYYGKMVWKYETKAPVFSRATISGDKIFITTSDDSIYCLDRATGKWVWHYRRSGNYITTIRGNSTPTVDGDHVLVGFSDGYLVSLKQKDGNLDWESKVHLGAKFTDVDAMPVVYENKIYIPSYDGGLYVLENKSGKVLWRVDFGGTRHVIIEGDILYIASTDGHVYALQRDSGRIIWKFELDRGAPTNLVMHNDYIAFGSSQQYFYVIDKKRGKLVYRFDGGLRGGFVSNPVEDKNVVYTLSSFGNLYTFRWKDKYNDKYSSFE